MHDNFLLFSSNYFCVLVRYMQLASIDNDVGLGEFIIPGIKSDEIIQEEEFSESESGYESTPQKQDRFTKKD